MFSTVSNQGNGLNLQLLVPKLVEDGANAEADAIEARVMAVENFIVVAFFLRV